MHERNGFDRPGGDTDTRGMAKRSPKQTIEWLCEGQSEYWQMGQGSQPIVNVYALHQGLKRWHAADPGKRAKPPSQSTLARLYAGETDSFSETTLEALSAYFDVPKAIIRGEVEWNSVEAWGMDITIAELRLISLMRKLGPEQKALVYEQIRVMLPHETPLSAPLITPKNVTPFRKSPKTS